MALTRAAIMFNFRKALQQADELDDIANDLSGMAKSEFEGTMQNISVNWKGENSRKYLAKGNRLQGDMHSTANSLHGIASDIRRVAKRIYNAEMRALAIAEARDY